MGFVFCYGMRFFFQVNIKQTIFTSQTESIQFDMRTSFLSNVLCIVVLSIALDTFAQYTNVKISDVDNPNETPIYINPKNTNVMIAGANISSYYYSFDGGHNWNRNPITSSVGVWGDPCVVIDTSGYFYFFHLSYPSTSTWLDRIVCQRSTNNGMSWNDGAGIGKNDPKQQDKEWAYVNPLNNDIYVTWTQFDNYGSTNPARRSNIMFSKSHDQGITWSSALQINETSGDCLDSDSTVEGAVPAAGPNGEIYVAWAGPVGLMFDRSLDGGLTWLDHDIHVCDIPGGWDYPVPGIYRANGLPVTCTDLSNGSHRGTIYINWTDERSSIGTTQDVDVWLAKSTDGGNTWTAPKRVNNDPPGKQQFFTWMAVDQMTGYLWFVFYDRRNFDDTRTDVYMATSKDGGETFENFKVSESAFIPNKNVFFGDYTGISAYNNIVRPIWTRLDTVVLSTWTAILDPYFAGILPGEKVPYAVEQIYPNPCNESTVFSFKLRVPTHLSLYVYDLFGHKVATLIEPSLVEPGKYIQKFEPGKLNLASGVYYFSLTGDGVNKRCKIIYQR